MLGFLVFGAEWTVALQPPLSMSLTFLMRRTRRRFRNFFSQFGFVKAVRNQKSLSKPNIYTLTRLVDLVFSKLPLLVVTCVVCGSRVNLSFATFAMCRVIRRPLVLLRTSVVCVGSLGILPAIVPILGE